MLSEVGLHAEALQYCEVVTNLVGQAVASKGAAAASYNPVFLFLLAQKEEQLRVLTGIQRQEG